MNLQYISDSSGKTTGVFIPINEWYNQKQKGLGKKFTEQIKQKVLFIKIIS